MFVLPVLTYTAPRRRAPTPCAGASRRSTWRASAPARSGCKGAAFPWRTIHGEECSSYWPAGTAAFHINADIADAVVPLPRRRPATQDFERDVGARAAGRDGAAVALARPPRRRGRFRIDGVTGPDEYSAIADNNVYTNLMAQRNLRAAADAVERHPRRAARAGGRRGGDGRLARRRRRRWSSPTTRRSGSTPRPRGSPSISVWDFEARTAEHYPLLLHFPYFDLYRKQVVKQADLVLALYVCGDAFTAEEKARNFDYYEALTVRDSSLSACTQAVMAAEVGHLDLAYDYFAEAALMDLDDLEHNTRDGVHIASLAGPGSPPSPASAGMRDHGGELSFSPRLPAALTRLRFRLMFRGASLLVEVDAGHARYSVVDGQVAGDPPPRPRETIEPGKTLELAIPHLQPRPAPSQPPGRAPTKRRPPPR